MTIYAETERHWHERVRAFERGFKYDTNGDWNHSQRVLRAVGRSTTIDQGLSPEQFSQIVALKLRRQRGRTEHHRESLTREVIQQVTGCAFSLRHADRDIEATIQVNLLTALPGVGAGLATAMLAMRFPSKHGVIDYRGWEVVFGEAKTGFLTSNYLSYLTELRLFAAQVGWSIQKADFMTWASFDDR